MITALKLRRRAHRLVNGFFVAAEFAFVGGGGPRIEAEAPRRATGARASARHPRQPQRLPSAAQLGITLASLALAILGEPTIAALIEGPIARALEGRMSAETVETITHGLAFAIAYSILTSLHITVGEQAPKLFGLERAERVAMFSALPMEVFYKTFRWPIHALDWASARMVRLFGLHASSAHASYTQEEIRQIIDMSHKGVTGGRSCPSQPLLASPRGARGDGAPGVAALPSPHRSKSRASLLLGGYSRLPSTQRLDEVAASSS